MESKEKNNDKNINNTENIIEKILKRIPPNL